MKSQSIARAGAVLTLTGVLAACAGFSPDGGLDGVSSLTRDRAGFGVQRESEAAQFQVAQLLASDLTPDGVVQIALLNNKRLQVALADLGVAEADLVQAVDWDFMKNLDTK